MRRFYLLVALFLCLLPLSAFAQDVDKTLSGLHTFWEKIDTFTADFVQNKRLALFSDEVVSRGTFAYKKPGIMVWRYSPPEDMIMSINSGTITLYYPSLKKAQRIHFAGSSEIPAGMTFGMGGTKEINDLKKNFTVTVTEKGGAFEMALVPNKADKEGITKLIISFKKDYTPLWTTIVESGGDTTTIRFSNQKINSPVKNAVFDVDIPAGVKIDEIGR